MVWILLGAAPVRGASYPPYLRFQSIDTPRVSVHFHQGLEALARQAAPLATEILERHEARYHLRVRPRVHVVLVDVDDDPNGYASPFPFPLVQIRATAPDGSDDFGNYEAWLRLVLTHELAHVVHLEQAGGIMGAGRRVFGRAPYLFPNALTPTWMTEGLATYEETRGTAFGRGRDPDARSLVRMAALEGRFPREDQAVAGLDAWPGGQASYVFGEAFLRDLAVKRGPEVLPELARVHSRKLIPYLDDFTAASVTGASFHARWNDFRLGTELAARVEPDATSARGLSESRPITARGVRQSNPRFSPDGAWIAYTSRTLTHYRAIRLVHPDGSGDRFLAVRNGGTALSWSRDGRTLVFDEPEVYRLFETRGDLRAVDVASGRVRRLTRGLRAHDPDLGPDGRIVFVRQLAERSELALLPASGGAPIDLTHSAPQTRWSGPRWSPDGSRVVASRYLPGGFLDPVLVDPASGGVTPLLADRAKDVEPAWTPDGSHVVFRSDRDGVSNLYALRLADGALFRVTNMLGGAFTPDVAPDGRSVAFARYAAAGYDVHRLELDLAVLPAASDFADHLAAPRPPPVPGTAPVRPYRPLPALLPRFWSPYLASISREWRVGAATGGVDPLLQHAYGVDVFRGSDTGHLGIEGFYQYDRFRPTLLATGQDLYQPDAKGPVHTRKLALQVSLPLVRSYRRSQSLSLAWQRESETRVGESAGLELGGLQASWTLSTVHQFPYSISPVEGTRLRLAALKEDPAFGSQVSLWKLTAEARSYFRLFGDADALALRLGGGTSVGRPGFERSFAVGGFPDAGLFDLVETNVAVLRGYPDNAFQGRRFAHLNLEYRVPLAHVQRGFWTLPVFVRHLHAAVFLDAGHAWSGPFALGAVKTGAGAALGTDVSLGHRIPATFTLGLARGFAAQGETRAYLRAGLAF